MRTYYTRFSPRRALASLGHRLIRFASEKPATEGLNQLNLNGDRDIEWSWVVGKIGNGPGKVLDFGCGPFGLLSMAAARRNFEVLSLDMESIVQPFTDPKITFVQGDILTIDLQGNNFDVIINCSTVEHVGLRGRYGVLRSRPNGDLESMERLGTLLKPEGIMLLTIPVGQDAVFIPYHRVYGRERLPELLDGYKILQEEYWLKNSENRWKRTDASSALSMQPSERLYGLGCFELSPT